MKWVVECREVQPGSGSDSMLAVALLQDEVPMPEGPHGAKRTVTVFQFKEPYSKAAGVLQGFPQRAQKAYDESVEREANRLAAASAAAASTKKVEDGLASQF